jgi:hypothetical protein
MIELTLWQNGVRRELLQPIQSRAEIDAASTHVDIAPPWARPATKTFDASGYADARLGQVEPQRPNSDALS